MSRRILCLGFLFGAMLSSPGWADELPFQCGPLSNAYGPYDYRTDLSKLNIVEIAHFTSDVENLRKGVQSVRPGPDLNYTLRAFPNHHRALMSIVRLGARDKSDKPATGYTVECFLMRAEAFRPDDPMVKLIYGIHLLNQGKSKLALVKLDDARELPLESPNFFYNLGLAYFSAGHYDRALTSAHKAYALGFPLPGLRDKLKRAGKWKDPEPVLSDEGESKEVEPPKAEKPSL
ncbi:MULTISPECIES: hypothetical protein [Zoogloea]|jgi:tetratricopeptide (TPR) repeat protein|uniref:Uncharacterized protein n=1 Tax=Zoogloea oleivorans TaxID=1552750 RepID=A0A6C2CZN2_9RHOO|nr:MULTISPECIES: hypothetical protein [Zoogloea]MDD2667238.1 hypothetical protein [Zoogloea sp.]TYC58772.1 hypothetical protein ETQ85_09565 [Zoogloea oleivorans]